MARPLRLEFAGALYHVTARGDRKEPIYEDDEDRDWGQILHRAFARRIFSSIPRFGQRSRR